MRDENYSRNLIKGRIVETIFSEMFRETKYYTIIPFGYENTIPQLAQYHDLIKLPKIIENFNSMPDFVLINKEKTSAYIVEVKFRSKLDNTEILKAAYESSKSWNPVYLFVATKEKFYFTPCNTIKNRNGEMDILKNSWVSDVVQKRYLNVLNEFIK